MLFKIVKQIIAFIDISSFSLDPKYAWGSSILRSLLEVALRLHWPRFYCIAKFTSFNDDFSSRDKVFSVTRSIYGVHLSVFPTHIMDVFVFSLILPPSCWLLALCSWLTVNSSSFRILKSSHTVTVFDRMSAPFRKSAPFE